METECNKIFQNGIDTNLTCSTSIIINGFIDMVAKEGEKLAWEVEAHEIQGIQLHCQHGKKAS